ncbi:hypothetical protein [Morganella morganii]|uniref:hypothetical protein n=1 Tax=Morganella morganii TaxID=582 RepID=UPI003D046551
MAFDWIAGTALVVGIGSLALTWQSTRAARRSIDTSIEIYEKQKQDELITEKNKNENELNALKVMIYHDVKSNLNKLLNIMDFCQSVWSMELIDYKYNDIASEPFTEYRTRNNGAGMILFSQHSDVVIDRYLLDVARIDGNLANKLIELKRTIDHFNSAFIVGLQTILKANADNEKVFIYTTNAKCILKGYEDKCIDIANCCILDKYNVN